MFTSIVLLFGSMAAAYLLSSWIVNTRAHNWLLNNCWRLNRQMKKFRLEQRGNYWVVTSRLSDGQKVTPMPACVLRRFLERRDYEGAAQICRTE